MDQTTMTRNSDSDAPAPDPSHVEHKLPKPVVDAVTYLVATSYDAGKHGATDSSSVRDACEELGFAIASELAVLQRRCGKAEALVSEIAAKDDRIAKLEAVVRNGIEHVESDTGAWGGWLVRAQIALRAGAPGDKGDAG